MHPGQGPGLSLHDLGEMSGSETVTLLESEIPAHTHSLMASGTSSSKPNPSGNSLARIQSGATPYLAPAGAPLANFADVALTPAGGDQPHNNLQPYLTFYFNIALQGVFPPRT
jgi:microcystin-dependent protein